LENVEFSKHEMSIALDVICPEDLNTSFNDIGGMEKEIEVIMDNVILPFRFWQEEYDRKLEASKLLEGEGQNGSNKVSADMDIGSIECHVPGGMLMYGRPGTGKVLFF
jgi:ATP-dependent 26S proteasome regulatory subunit